MITVINKHHKLAVSPKVYIGRGSSLGNPFVIDPEHSRERVCEMYEAHFDAKVRERNPEFMDALAYIYRLAQQGDVYLECFCAPKRCHGDTIKKFLDAHMEISK